MKNLLPDFGAVMIEIFGETAKRTHMARGNPVKGSFLSGNLSSRLCMPCYRGWDEAELGNLPTISR